MDNDLDLNLLFVFEAMLVHRNVTAAATDIGITQSAMSNAVGRLRRYFGDPLFISTRNGMLPTPRAQELAGPLQRALTLVRSASNKATPFDPAQSERTFRFHMTDVGETVFLPELVKHLDEIGTSIRIETVQLSSEQMRHQLESGGVDFAVGYLPGLSRNLQSRALFREHYVGMCRKDHRLAGAAAPAVRDFLAEKHVFIESMGSGHRVIERTLKRHGLKREAALRVPHFMVVPIIVGGTDRIVTAPSRVARVFAASMGLHVFALPIRIPSFDVALFWHPRFAEDPGIRWMEGLMARLFQQMPERRDPPGREREVRPAQRRP